MEMFTILVFVEHHSVCC